MISDIHNHKRRASCTGYHISGDDVDGSFSLFGKKEWNALPDRLKNLENINIFKVNLKKYFFDYY